jgi:hypothetical protein
MKQEEITNMKSKAAGNREWLPIETAPLNDVVDLFVTGFPNRAGFRGFRYTDCYRRSDGEWTSKNFDSEQRKIIKHPSHWMPLPQAPDDNKEGR